MHDRLTSQLTLEGTLHLLTALRVGAGRSLGPDSTDLPVIKDSFGRPYIPGSSFKGVFRSLAERLLRASSLDPQKMRKLACNPLSEAKTSNPDRTAVPDFRRCLAPNEVEEKKRKYPNNLDLLDQELIEESCLACRLFGSPWLSSSLQVRDLLIEEEFLYPKQRYTRYEIRNGVAINRDTETANEGQLYDFEVIPAGTIFKFAARLENADPASQGLFFLALHNFEQGRQALGGASSRGLGAVNLKWSGYYFEPAQAGANPSDRLDAIFDYLLDTKNGSTFLSPGSQATDDLIKERVAALREKIKELVRD